MTDYTGATNSDASEPVNNKRRNLLIGGATLALVVVVAVVASFLTGDNSNSAETDQQTRVDQQTRTQKPITENPITEKPVTEQPDTIKPEPEKTDRCEPWPKITDCPCGTTISQTRNCPDSNESRDETCPECVDDITLYAVVKNENGRLYTVTVDGNKIDTAVRSGSDGINNLSKADYKSTVTEVTQVLSDGQGGLFILTSNMKIRHSKGEDMGFDGVTSMTFNNGLLVLSHGTIASSNTVTIVTDAATTSPKNTQIAKTLGAKYIVASCPTKARGILVVETITQKAYTVENDKLVEVTSPFNEATSLACSASYVWGISNELLIRANEFTSESAPAVGEDEFEGPLTACSNSDIVVFKEMYADNASLATETSNVITLTFGEGVGFETVTCA